MRRGVFEGKNQFSNVCGNGAVVMFAGIQFTAITTGDTKLCPIGRSVIGRLVLKGFRIKFDKKSFLTVVGEVKAVVEGGFCHGVFIAC